MKLSIVTTMYRSAPYLREFYARAIKAADVVTDDYEIIFVNDGSPDDSLDTALSLYGKDAKVKVVDLSRNFGHHKAIMTGLGYARGDIVFLIDCDMEEEPELLGRFHEEMKKTGADVVYGVQEKRKGGLLERMTGDMFYRLFNMLSNYPVPANLTCLRLMTGRYVKSLVEHKDREIFLAGLWAITGYRQVPVAIKKLHKGSSTYTFGRKLSVLVNSITSFSNRPLVFIFYLGFIIIAFSGSAAIYLVVRRVFFGVLLAGWPSLIVSVWMLGGLTIFCVGVIGIYLSKIFMETKDRPYTVIRAVYERNKDSGGRK
ncbi:MAG: glycosyltransferase family 2 protein [Deltaproteobacteria bacterium]|nr:glycosyltransferase family 2 protein [Deltaproteobacteria bacterium]